MDFLDGVLRHVRGLDPAYIRVQHPVVGALGTPYRVDFAVLRPGQGQSIAIEIDGFQKDKLINESTEARMASTSARQNDITAAGWSVLRFTNHQGITRQGACQTDIETYRFGR